MAFLSSVLVAAWIYGPQWTRTDELERQQQSLEALVTQNGQLESDIGWLRYALASHSDDPYILEARARREHSLVLPDEEVLVFEPTDTENHAWLAYDAFDAPRTR